jgi:hypothetical protein
MPPSQLPVRASDLDDVNALRSEVPSQRGAVAAGALDANDLHLPEAAEPPEHLPVAGRSGHERLRAQDPADLVERGRDMQVLVSVDAAGDDDVIRCQSGQGPSFSLASSGAGTARAEGRTGQGRACVSRLLLGHSPPAAVPRRLPPGRRIT